MPDQLPLAGKSILIIEDEPLIAMSVEATLLEAGGTAVKIVSSVAQAQSALENASFDAAVVDYYLSDGDARPLIEFLTGRGISTVVTTGDSIVHEQPDFSKAVTVLQKPYSERDLIKVLTWLTQARITG
jgi:DNA-binding NtrC family response regulator